MECLVEVAAIVAGWFGRLAEAAGKNRRPIAIAIALKLLTPGPLTLSTGCTTTPFQWTCEQVAARLGQAGFKCGKSTVSDWAQLHAGHRELIQSGTLDEVIELARSTRTKGRPPIFTDHEVDAIINLLEAFARASCCLTKAQAAKYLKPCSETTSFDGSPRRAFVQDTPSRSWWATFLKRAKGRVRLRKGRVLEVCRAAALTPDNLGTLPTQLKQAYDQHPLLTVEPSRVSNFDESEISSRVKGSTVLGASWGRVALVGGGHNNSLGRHITGVFLVCADGTAPLPPMLIFTKGTNVATVCQHVPIDACSTATTEKGYMTSDLFKTYLREWRSCMRERHPSGPLLLIMDGSSTHSLEHDLVAEFFYDQIQILVLPAHTSTETQPLDRTVFGYFKRQLQAEYASAIAAGVFASDDQMRVHCALNAWYKISQNTAVITAGFKKTGIWPLDKNAYCEWVVSPDHASRTESLIGKEALAAPVQPVSATPTDTASVPNLLSTPTLPVVESAEISHPTPPLPSVESGYASVPDPAPSLSPVRLIFKKARLILDDADVELAAGPSSEALERDALSHVGKLRELLSVPITVDDIVQRASYSLAIQTSTTYKHKHTKGAYLAITEEAMQRANAKKLQEQTKIAQEMTRLMNRSRTMAAEAAAEHAKFALTRRISALQTELAAAAELQDPLREAELAQARNELAALQASTPKRTRAPVARTQTPARARQIALRQSEQVLSQAAEPVAANPTESLPSPSLPILTTQQTIAITPAKRTFSERSDSDGSYDGVQFTDELVARMRQSRLPTRSSATQLASNAAPTPEHLDKRPRVEDPPSLVIRLSKQATNAHRRPFVALNVNSA